MMEETRSDHVTQDQRNSPDPNSPLQKKLDGSPTKDSRII